MIKQELINPHLAYYNIIIPFDLLRDADSLVGDISSVSDWSYAIPYLIIYDGKEF